MFYVIGTYGKNDHSVLGEYDTIIAAQSAIRWQGQPRNEIEWLDAKHTVAETWFSGGRNPNFRVRWKICEPSNARGVFTPLDGSGLLSTNRGCYTVAAYEKLTESAVALARKESQL